MKQHIRTEIIINASSERVWQILMDFAGYRSWNPFIVDLRGNAAVGSRLLNTIVANGKEYTFKPIVTENNACLRFEWLGNLFIKGIFDGRHYFEIETVNDTQVKFIHGEIFSGLLASGMLNKIGTSTRLGFIEMNQALKRIAEQR